MDIASQYKIMIVHLSRGVPLIVMETENGHFTFARYRATGQSAAEETEESQMSRRKSRIKVRLRAGCVSVSPPSPQAGADRRHERARLADRCIPGGPALLDQLLARHGKPPARKR
jgi:hypothetical protein